MRVLISLLIMVLVQRISRQRAVRSTGQLSWRVPLVTVGFSMFVPMGRAVLVLNVELKEAFALFVPRNS